MKDFKEINSTIEELIKESTDEKLTKKYSSLLAQVSAAEEHYNKESEDHVNLVKEYGKLVLKASSKDTPEDENSTEEKPTFEEFLENGINKLMEEK